MLVISLSFHIRPLSEADLLFLLHYQYETIDKHLTPDGQYVPRILFVGKNTRFVRNSKTLWLDLLFRG